MIPENIIKLLDNNPYSCYVQILVNNSIAGNNANLIIEDRQFKLSISSNWIILSTVTFKDNISIIYTEANVMQSYIKDYHETYNYVIRKLEDRYCLPIEDITQNYFTYIG